MTQPIKQKRATLEDPFTIPEDKNPILGIFEHVQSKNSTDSYFTIDPKDRLGKSIYGAPQTLIMPDGKKICRTSEELILYKRAASMLPGVIKRIDTTLNEKNEKLKKVQVLKDKIKKGVTISDEEHELLVGLLN